MDEIKAREVWSGDFFDPLDDGDIWRFQSQFPNLDMLRLVFRDAEKYRLSVAEIRLTQVSADELAVDIYRVAQMVKSLADADKLQGRAERLKASAASLAKSFTDAMTLLDTAKIRAELAEMEADDLRADAERYRWLRQFEVDSYLACGSGETLDAAIDAAKQAAE